MRDRVIVKNNPVNKKDPLGLAPPRLDPGQLSHDPNYILPPDNGFNHAVGSVCKVVTDQAAQTAAEKLALKYLGQAAFTALSTFNFLTNIFDPFPDDAW